MNTIIDFLNGWKSENINADVCDPPEGHIEQLASECLLAGKIRGISEADLIEAAGGNLHDYIVAEMGAATDRQSRRIADKEP